MTATQPTILDGRYRLVAPIGAGGMSVIWRGVDEVLARPVAVKVLASQPAGGREPAADPDRVRREAMAIAKINHPYIANVFDYGESAGTAGVRVPYLVMELVEGESLAAVLARGPLSWPTVAGIGAQAASALAAAHRYGVIHGDVTPANIMLGIDGVKVIDFGVAASPGQAADAQIFGTPPYLAPERLAGTAAQPAADVFGLGVVLFQALAGRLPWPEPADARSLAARRSIPPAPLPPIPGLPPYLAHLCRQSLAADPAARPPSELLSTELSAIARSGDPHARRSAAAVPAAPPAPAAPPVPSGASAPASPPVPSGPAAPSGWPETSSLGAAPGQQAPAQQAPGAGTRPATRILPHGVAALPDAQAETVAIRVKGSARAYPPPQGRRADQHGIFLLPTVLLALLVACLTWASLHPGDPGLGDAGTRPTPGATAPHVVAKPPSPTAKPSTAKPSTANPGTAKHSTANPGAQRADGGNASGQKAGAGEPNGSGRRHAAGKQAAGTAAQPDVRVAPAAATCRVRYRAVSQWVFGFSAQITIVNTGTSAFQGWTLRFDVQPGQRVGSGWNAVWQQQGRTVTATATEANSAVPAGGEVIVGFVATQADSATRAAPSRFTVNGRACG